MIYSLLDKNEYFFYKSGRQLMKQLTLTVRGFLVLCLLVSAGAGSMAQQKLAQTGLQFLSVYSDARAAAMAGAVNSLSMQSASLFFNPAAMANSDEFVNLSASYNTWIADIKYTALTLSIRPAHGDYGVIGFSFQNVDYGDIEATMYDPTAEAGYTDLGIIKPKAFAIGVGYAKQLSDAFSVGGHVRYVRQTLGDALIPIADTGNGTTYKKYQVSPVSFDFGTIYHTPFKSLTFGMAVRNFSAEVKYEQESFQLPLTFTLGLSMDVMDVLPMNRNVVKKINASAELIHNRDYYEQGVFGVEVNLLDILMVRGGYITKNDNASTSFGFGVAQFGLEVDYSYTPFSVFNNVQRLTVRYSY